MTTLPSTEDLARLAKAITPGPWNWQVSRQSRSVELSGGRQTKAGGDLTVMSFARWGLQGAAPVFWTWTGNIAEEVQRADEIAVPEPGREHHADWFARIDHPDAELIALAPALLREVLDRREAEGWRPETNILPWVALTIEQMRRFEASSGDLERLGLNGEWIPTDTPLSPGLVYRIKPTTTTEARHGE